MRHRRGRPKGVRCSAQLPFTQTEIMRAIRATQKVGFAVKHIVINPLKGTICIEPAGEGPYHSGECGGLDGGVNRSIGWPATSSAVSFPSGISEAVILRVARQHGIGKKMGRAIICLTR